MITKNKTKFAGFLIFLFLLNFTFSFLSAADQKTDWPQNVTQAELDYIKDQLSDRQPDIFDPPRANVRVPAEFEPVDGVIVTWASNTDILTKIVKEVVDVAKAYIVVSSSSQQTTVQNTLTSNGISLTNVRFIIAAYNSVWQRDYGPIMYYDSSNNWGVNDYIYRHWSARPSDDAIPQKVATYFSIPRTGVSLVLDGGNYMTDGQGTSFYTTRMYEWNNGSIHSSANYTQTQVNSMMTQYTGHTNNVVVAYQNNPFDGTGHVDMFSKIITPLKIIVSQTSSGSGNYNELNQIATAFSNAKNTSGQNFQVTRIPAYFSGSTCYTYTNSLMVNSKVLVPIYGTSTDSQALQVYQNLLPSHTIIGINCSAIITSGGSIHCITQTVPSASVLQPPTANFTFSTNGLTASFTDTSTDNGTITKWAWIFGNGTTSTVKNPTCTYASAGTYTVTLTVTDNDNQTGSIPKPVSVGPQPPVADFIYTTSGTTANFTDKSTDNGTITKYQWSFIKNGSQVGTSTLQNPSCNYNEYGTFQAKLTVTDNEVPAQTGTVTKNVVISDVPPTPCASAGTDYSYFWFSNIKLGTLDNTSAGDGYKDFSQTVAAPELKKGSTYTLTMTLNTAQYSNWFKAYIDYNRDGDFEDAGEVIYVSAAAGKIQSDGGPITIPSTAVKGLTWMRVQVKNSTSSNLPAPEPCETIAYGEVEDYYVNITEDCSTPVANFTFTVNQCTASFTSTSTSTDPIVSYNWNFGNGSSSTLANSTCTYGANGNYNVTLTVTNSCGKSASVTKTVSITNCSPNCPYDHLVGSFPGIGIWLRDSQTAAWTQLSKQQADIIRLGDVNGNGLDDIAALFKSSGKLWYRYDSGIWEDIPASAATLIAYDLRDMNNDNIEDLVGSWSDKGLWWRNNANGVWTKLSNMVPTLVASGDFDGDKKADVVGLFPSLSSIWIYYSNNTWKQISKQINLVDLRVGNMDSDAKAELVGSWDIGVWTFDPETNNWVQHNKNKAKQIAVGDINAGCMQDIVGYWDAATPLFVKFLETNIWKELSKYNPDTIDAGRVK
jgi:agmatine/peptidylarginine deiminase